MHYIVLGGKILYYKNEEEKENFINLMKTWHGRLAENGNFDPESDDTDPWIPFTDEEIEDEWVHHSSRESIKFSDWFPGQPNDGLPGNCAIVRLSHEPCQKLGIWWFDMCCTCRIVRFSFSVTRLTSQLRNNIFFVNLSFFRA